MQDAINQYFPLLPPFFGSSKSRNNEIYMRWGIKQRANDDMRADFVRRARKLVEDELGLTLPDAQAFAA